MIGTRQAAMRLGVTPRQVRRLVAAGQLTAAPLGDHANAPLVIDAASLERLIATRAAAPPRPGRRRTKAERSAP